MVHFAIVCLIEQLLEFGKKLLSNFLAQHAMLFKCRIVFYSTSKLNPALYKKKHFGFFLEVKALMRSCFIQAKENILSE